MIRFQQQIEASVSVLQALAEQHVQIEAIAGAIRDTVLGGNLLLTCGNGGSATDAQHLAEELIARYRANRRALPAISLAADVSVLTCIGNDYGFEYAFSRQVEGLGKPGDLLVCFSTSGNSPNILAALRVAKERGLQTVALLGKDGGAARGLADHEIIVPSDASERIQEGHLQILHYICEVVEQAVLAES